MAAVLTLVSVPLWSQLGLPDESQSWIKRGFINGFESKPFPSNQRMVLLTPEVRAI
jgi:hypothetical protein